MATSSFVKQYKVPKHKSNAFCKEFKREAEVTLAPDFKTQSVSLSEDGVLKAKLQEVLSAKK